MSKKNNELKRSTLASTFLSYPEMGVILPLVILLVVIAFVNSNFFRIDNLVDVLRSTSYTFIIAAPLSLLLIAGGLDLSIGSSTALGSVVAGWGLAKLNLPIIPTLLLVIFAGFVVGFVKSVLIVTYDLPAFIITLGITKILDSFILVATDGIAVTGLNNKRFKVLGQGKAFGVVHWTIIIAVIIGIVMHIVLTRTKFGRAIAATGGNRETAKLAGINVPKTRYIVEIMVTMFATFCGALYCSRFNSGQPGAGVGTELTIMASVIIGGTSMFGGTGSIFGSFLGCLLLAVINNGLVLMRVSTNWQNMIFGLILIASLFIDKYRRSMSGGRL